MAGAPITSNQPAEHRAVQPRFDTARWYGALDAMAPYLIVLIAVAIARHTFASTMPAMLAVVVTVILLAIGTGGLFFWNMSDAHLTWPVACALFVLMAPFLALHASLENSALNAPTPALMLPLAFTWIGLLVMSLLIAGHLYTTATNHPGWAGVIVAPIAALIATVAATSPDASLHAALTALLTGFAVAEVAAGIGWLLSERYRWFLIMPILGIGTFAAARIVLTTSHHLPGRWLLLGDAALAAIIGMIALASPILCRWLKRVTSNE